MNYPHRARLAAAILDAATRAGIANPEYFYDHCDLHPDDLPIEQVKLATALAPDFMLTVHASGEILGWEAGYRRACQTVRECLADGEDLQKFLAGVSDPID